MKILVADHLLPLNSNDDEADSIMLLYNHKLIKITRTVLWGTNTPCSIMSLWTTYGNKCCPKVIVKKPYIIQNLPKHKFPTSVDTVSQFEQSKEIKFCSHKQT